MLQLWSTEYFCSNLGSSPLWLVEGVCRKKHYNLQYLTLIFLGNSTRRVYLLSSHSVPPRWQTGALSFHAQNITLHLSLSSAFYMSTFTAHRTCIVLGEYQASHTVDANRIHIRTFHIVPKADKEMQRCILNPLLPTF